MPPVRRLASAFLLGLTALGWAATGPGYSKVGMTFAGTICVDAATGEVLSQERADALGHPASVTKLMTMLLVLEDVQAGKTTLATRVTVTKAAAGVGGSQVWLAPGESFPVSELLYALMLQSANDAAVALAVDRAETVPAFVARMNQRAAQLGMSRTRFVTPNGLTTGIGPHDTTTARDLAKLCVELCKRPEALRFTGTREHSFARFLKPVAMVNHNHLLPSFPGCDGLKTGWTVAAKASMATTATDGPRRVIAVVLGCDSPQGAKAAQRLRDQLAGELMKDGLGKLAAKELAKATSPKPVPTVAAVVKTSPTIKPEPGFWDWVGDLFSF
jgi:D-alanyl-D-alanine carboxypeptidase (penicillin-binding protein 5/6)